MHGKRQNIFRSLAGAVMVCRAAVTMRLILHVIMLIFANIMDGMVRDHWICLLLHA